MKISDLLEKLQKVTEEHGDQVDVEFTFTEIKNDNKTHWSREIQEFDLFDFSWKEEIQKVLAITLK
tara:strand:+ start:563 stop:760 length:198 start_codon:yes stop_codon:yes gene_type:complete